MTPAAMIDAVLSNLGESADSPAGQYTATPGGSVTDTTRATVLRFLNDIKGDMTRGPWLVAATGTASSVTARVVPLQSLVTTDNGYLWAVRGNVKWGTAVLKHIGRGVAELSSALMGSGTPAYYAVSGSNVTLYPAPSAPGTLTADGFEVPPDMADNTTVPTWIPADQHSLLVWGGAGLFCDRNLEDGRLGVSGAVWRAKYEREYADQLNRLTAAERELVAAHLDSRFSDTRG